MTALSLGLGLAGGRALSGLVFSAPFDNPANPLKVLRGGPLTIVRATEALRFDGTKYVDAANNILRIEKGINGVTLGALIEGQRTFTELLRTDTSQNQLASWTSTGITASSDADVDSYGGNRWTLTADGSDRVFVQTITIAAATRSLAFYVRRSDGGVVDGTFCLIYREGSDRTTTYTHVGGNVYQVQEANFTGSAGAAATGLKVKAGKTVQLVAPPGLENGAFSSSAIPTVAAAVTRNADLLTFSTTGISGTVGTVYVEIKKNVDTGATIYIVNLDEDGYSIPVLGSLGPENVVLYDGANRLGPIWLISDISPTKICTSWGRTAITCHLVRDGGAVTEAVFDGDMNIDTVGQIGSNPSEAENLWGHIKNLRIYDKAFSDNRMKDMTA